MNSKTTEKFWKCFNELPADVRRQARSAYRTFERDNLHPGLRFKKVHATRPIYSIRIGLGYRALGVLEGDDMIWFWIGTHADYDNLLRRT